jgi:23S rRNA (cytosine1962-C5)-methyltransferase
MSVALRVAARKEVSLLKRHPIVFPDSWTKESYDQLHNGETRIKPGTVADVFDHSGETFLARGTLAPITDKKIGFMAWVYPQKKQLQVDAQLISDRLKQAIKLRREYLFQRAPAEAAYRVVWAEADLLPGIIIDKYSSKFVVQIRNGFAEIEGIRDVICETLEREYGRVFCTHIFERSDALGRIKSGLENRTQVLKSASSSSRNPWEVEFVENGLIFQADLLTGQKTGFYLDQSQNRKLVRDYVKDKDVLDCFSFTGGFTVNAMKGGAKSVMAVEMSSPALERLSINLSRNFKSNADIDKVKLMEGNAFEILKHFRKEKQMFDVVVLDPPKMMNSGAEKEVNRGLGAYRSLNESAMRLIRPGGFFFTFSCSQAFEVTEFQKMLRLSAVKLGRSVQVLSQLHQAPDHPVLTSFPESDYLKGALCRVI